jgi:hypothetical protein
MNALVIWVLALAVFVFFRQELTKYYGLLDSRPRLMVVLITAVISYLSINNYAEFHAFLIFIIYQVNRLKFFFEQMLPFNTAPYFKGYFFHFVVFSILLISFARYEAKHKSLIYQEQVLLLRQLINILFLLFVLIFSYGYDLRMYF